jgi:hypothetical protein
MAQRKFKRQVSNWQRKTGIQRQRILKSIAFHLYGRVVELTPVDTGRARASWTLIAGEVADKTVAPERKSDRDKPLPNPPSVTEYPGKAIGFVDLANVYTIANALPYIQALEEGHSQQAPAGMAKLAMVETRLWTLAQLG